MLVDAGPDYLNKVDCPRCGKFTVLPTLESALKGLSGRQVANLSGWLRENPQARIDHESKDRLFSLRTPAVAEKADKLLNYIARTMPSPGQKCYAQQLGRAALAAGWAEDHAELTWLLDSYLEADRGWLEKFVSSEVAISPSGWSRIDELRRGSGSGAVGFIAMWFNDEVKAASEAIDKAITVAGYEPVRVDRVEHNNRIDDEIIARIRGSKFLVADLTGQRGGVYFEAGFALGFGLPVIWLVREDGLETVHFDNRQYNFIVWKPDALDDLEQRLRNRIEATLGRGPFQDKANVVAKKGETRPAEVVAASVFTTP